MVTLNPSFSKRNYRTKKNCIADTSIYHQMIDMTLSINIKLPGRFYPCIFHTRKSLDGSHLFFTSKKSSHVHNIIVEIWPLWDVVFLNSSLFWAGPASIIMFVNYKYRNEPTAIVAVVLADRWFVLFFCSLYFTGVRVYV